MKNVLRVTWVLASLLLGACSTPVTSGRNEVPSLVYEEPAKYPFDLRKQGASGSATVDFVVNTEGNVVNAFALAATAPEFGREAVAAVSRWKFKPGRRNGVPVNTHLQVPVYFTLYRNQPLRSD